MIRCPECRELTTDPIRRGAHECGITGVQIGAAAVTKERDCDNEELARKFGRRVARRIETLEAIQPEVSRMAVDATEVRQGSTEARTYKWDDQVMAMWGQGLRVGQIASRTKINSDAVVRALRRHQVPLEEIEARRIRRTRNVVQDISSTAAGRVVPDEMSIPQAMGIVGTMGLREAVPEPTSVDDLTDERAFNLDEESETPDVVIDRFVGWIHGDPVRRIAGQVIAVGQAQGLSEIIFAMYGRGPETAELLTALRKVTERRIQSLGEAS